MATASDIRPALQARSFDRILLIKPSSLGDIVHGLPVLDGLRTRFPKATIDWLVAAPFAPLLAGHPQISNLIPFERSRYGKIGRSPRASAEFVRFVADLRRRRYELAIDLQGLLRSGFLAWCSRAPVRIGFQDAREGARLFYTHRLRPPIADMHAVDKNYLVAAALGFADHPIRFPLEVDTATRRDVKDRLTAGGVMGELPLVGIAPGARWETKRWPAERFVCAIEALQTAIPCDCVLVGGPDEVALCASIAAKCQHAPLVLAGRTGLKELSALIAMADLVLCHDSAVAHLAAAHERPLLCLTGPTNPARTGPYGRLQDVMRLDLPCSPCYFRRLTQCPHHHQCMNDLAAVDVVAAMVHRLAPDTKRRLASPESTSLVPDQSMNQ